MAAPGVFDNYHRIRSRHGGSSDFDVFPANQPIAASLTVKKYDLLSLNSSGALQQAIALPGTNYTGTESGGNLPLAGVALCDFTTDSNGVLTTPNQGGIASGAGYGANASNFGCPPVAKFTDLEYLLRNWGVNTNISVSASPYGTPSLTTTQQDDVVIGYSNYQFMRFRGSSSSVWWYALTTTTTNGEMVVVERALEAVGSALTDNFGLLWVRPIISNTVRQI